MFIKKPMYSSFESNSKKEILKTTICNQNKGWEISLASCKV
jgi:hypothetical protein